MSAPRGLSIDETAILTRRITLLSVTVATGLTVIKAIAWQASGSVAMLASMADSGLDLFASLVTFFAVRYAAAPPDAEHKFGHGKAEAFASLVQAGLVFASAALVTREAVGAFLNPAPLRAEGWALAVMVVSIVASAGLVWAQTQVLKRASSVAVSGDRMHYATDLASNLITIAGIGAAAWLGVAGFDAAAAVLVAGLLLWGAISVFREAANQLLDRELEPEARAQIIRLASADPRVTGVHELRTRASGSIVHIQMHVDLDPDLTLEAAHEVIVETENRILSKFPAADILIHADPRGRAEPHGGAFGETRES